jgi:hypothetical protein
MCTKRQFLTHRERTPTPLPVSSPIQPAVFINIDIKYWIAWHFCCDRVIGIDMTEWAHPYRTAGARWTKNRWSLTTPTLTQMLLNQKMICRIDLTREWGIPHRASYNKSPTPLPVANQYLCLTKPCCGLREAAAHAISTWRHKKIECKCWYHQSDLTYLTLTWHHIRLKLFKHTCQHSQTVILVPDTFPSYVDCRQ